jgi:hypothetical protein
MAFIDIFAPILLKLYEHIFDEKTLSNSQKVSYITLICKDPVSKILLPLTAQV